MLKKFIEGLIFGGGFAISFIGLSYLAAYSIAPSLINSIEKSTEKKMTNTGAIVSPTKKQYSVELEQPEKQFHELSIEEQIQKSSVIALARYEKSDDGKMKAIITELLKNEPSANFNYKVGDEYKSSSYYPSENRDHGDGIVIFFTGSPASMKMSFTFMGNRIGGLADIPIELFRTKCKAPNA